MVRKKIRTGILGATGLVGQRLVDLLWNHPDFVITSLSASKKNTGKLYRDAVLWKLPSDIPREVGELSIKGDIANDECDVVISSLPSIQAKEIEDQLKKAGVKVITNSSPHRMDDDVPLLIPEVNPEHIELLKGKKNFIIANPNCTAIALTLALAPLYYSFGLTDVMVSTYQAISGAGYPGVSAIDVNDNLIPYIPGEEPKLEVEPKKILGKFDGNRINSAPINISSHCIRINVSDGHFLTVSVKLKNKANNNDIIEAFNTFSRLPPGIDLPTLPKQPLRYINDESRPQPRLDRDFNKGMTVSIGRLRKCSVLDYKFVLLGHNTIRGAAGAAVANAELCLNLRII